MQVSRDGDTYIPDHNDETEDEQVDEILPGGDIERSRIGNIVPGKTTERVLFARIRVSGDLEAPDSGSV